MKKKSKKKKKIGLIHLIGMIIFMIGILSGIFTEAMKSNTKAEENQQKYFAIVPHFTLQEKTLENFYSFLQTTYSIKINEPINIVIISPDSFGASKNTIDMLCKESNKFCFQEVCISAKALPASKTSGCLDPKTTNEQGLGIQFSFIKKFFPQAKIFPIVIKPRKFIENAQVINTINNYPFIGKTLVLASVDFSQYTDEDFAQLHDKKSWYTLNNAKETNEYTSLAVDCPSCLHLVNTLAQENKQYPQLFLRDSKSSLAGKNLGTKNSSRQFVFYTNQKQEENGFTIAFFGDLIFDRQVSKTLSGEQNIKEYFEMFFEKEDTNLPLKKFTQRKLYGIDFVGLNLETPVVGHKKICQKSGKNPKFCSSAIILPYLKNIGFTIVNIANNHSFDGGVQAHLETIQQIKNNGLNYMGYVRSGPYFEKDYTYKTTLRGLKIARQGFDFTITPKRLFSGYCTNLQKNKTEGYINMVSVHRGNEYKSNHSAKQESLGKQLIDCGAEIIIGHHPHVIQDIGRYKGKPIIYSLGNFLFDMKTRPETKTGGYVLIDYQKNGTITIFTGTINASIYK